MSARAVLLSIGGVILLAGVVLGFVPMTAHGVSCGSALKGNSAARVSDLVDSFSSVDGGAEAACDDKRSTYRPIVWTLIVAGGALVFIGAVAGTPKSRPQPGG